MHLTVVCHDLLCWSMSWVIYYKYAISSMLTEIFLQHLEGTRYPNMVQTRCINFIKWYVDDIIHDFRKANHGRPQSNTHKHKIHIRTRDHSYLQLLGTYLHRHDDQIKMGIYHKSTQTDMTIHNTPNQPDEHKTAPFNYTIHRINSLPITQQTKHKELNRIQLATNNGYDLTKLKLHKSQMISSDRKNRPHTCKISHISTHIHAH